MKNLLLILIVSLGFPLKALSYEEKFNAEIKAAYINSSNQALIQVKGVIGWLKLGDTDKSDTRSMFAIALAAKSASQNDLWVRWEPVTTGYPQVTILSMGY